MYCAKQRARFPLSIALPATEQVGNETPLRPAADASLLIAAGVMSGVPTIASCFRLEFTVERPLAPSAITATPKAIRIAPEMKPPISRTLFIVLPPWKLFDGFQSRRGPGGGHPGFAAGALRRSSRLRGIPRKREGGSGVKPILS